MTIKTAYRYQMSEQKRPVIIYYCVILVVLSMIVLETICVNAYSGRSTFMGLDFATAIFIFVTGLCSFKEPFLMLLQNGVSRKSIFQSRIYAALSMAAVLAAIDKIILLLGKSIMLLNSRFTFLSFYEQVYAVRRVPMSPILLHVNIFVFDFLMYLAAVAAGYCITILFYRLNKGGKLAVAVGVPVGLTFVLPMIDSAFFNSRISYALGLFIDFAFGLKSANPYAAMITFAVTFIVFGGLGWLLMRKAVVKL